MSDFDDIVLAAREGFEPSAEDRERVWNRISVRAGLAGAAVALVAKASAGTPGSTVLAGQSVGALVKLFFTSVAVTLVAGSAVVGVTRFRAPSHEAAPVSAPVATAHAPRSEPGVAPEPGGRAEATTPSTVADAPRAEPARAGAALPSSEEAPPGRPEIARELALLKAVKQAVSAGQQERAVHLLDDLDRELPQGALLEERAALRAIAACEGGAVNRPERARAFLRRYPASVYAAKVQHVCQDAPPTGQAAGSSTRSFTDAVETGH